MIDDRYSLEEQIGVGGMATVWRATDTLLGRQLAIKRLSPHLKSDRAASERFRREGQAAARLNHPGILTVFDAGEDGDGPWIAMELIEGETLAKRLAATGPMDLVAVASFMEQAAAAVDYAHENGIVHRDIKPANLMIEPGGRVRLADFGIAKPLDDPATITSPGEMVGTISYVAPEIIAGQQASRSSDIYSLAAVAYEMLTGEKPFSSETTAGLLEMIRRGKGPDLAGKVPPAVVPALTKALDRDPAMRPDSARAFAAELNQPSTLVLPIDLTEPDPGRAPALFEGSSDPTVLMQTTTERSKPPPAVVAPVAAGPVVTKPVTNGATASGWSRRSMALAGGLVLLVLVTALAMAGDNPDSSLEGLQASPTTTTNAPTTTTNAPTTTLTAAPTTPAEVTPASLAVEIGDILAGLHPPEYKPKDVAEFGDGVSEAIEQWENGRSELAASSLQDAFASLGKFPESEARDQLLVLLVTLTEKMGFRIESDDDD